MEMRSRFIVSISILVACIGLYLYCCRLLSTFVPDDSYITFRYAENLAKGHGITFNAGEQPVEGYTNFLWVLVCALFSRLGFSLPTATPVVGTLLGLFSVVIFWVLLKRHEVPPLLMALVLGLFAASGPVVLYAISGMETPLYVFLLTGSIVCLDFLLVSPNKMKWSMLLSVDCLLLSLCRPEGILTYPVILLCVYLLIRLNRLPGVSMDSLWRPTIVSAVCFVVFMGIYQVWRVTYFHELLPTSFMSKGGNGVSVFAALKMNAKFYFVRQNRYFAPFGYYHVALVLCGGLMLWFAHRGKSFHPVAGISMLLALIYVALYSYFVDWMPGMRYHAALVSLALAPVICLKDTKKSHLIAVIIFLVVATGVSVLSFQKLEVDARRNEDSTLNCLVPLGNWLKNSVPANALLAIHDVGVVPYYSELRTFDSNPQSLTDIHIAKHGFSAEYFFERNPDVAIFSSEGSLKRRIFFPHYAPLIKDPKFREKYKLIGISQYDQIQRSYWVYVRRDLTLKPEDLKLFPLGLRI